jgi:RNA polymerase sigma factor (sigma-70 family)
MTKGGLAVVLVVTDHLAAVPQREGARGAGFARYVEPEIELLYRVAVTLTGQHADDGPADGPSTEDLVVGGQFDAVVTDALRALPDKHRAVVRLVDVDGLSYAEAAQALGVPRGTVMSRLHRARARIRTRLVTAGLVTNRSRS